MLHITKMTKVLFINFDYAAFGDATQVENDPTCFVFLSQRAAK
jgi:hypothetical protein